MLAAASSAAAAVAAASTTTAVAFLRLFTFCTGMIDFFPGMRNVYVFVTNGFLLLHPAMQQEFVAWFVLVHLDG